ncbi:7277_t:CDS:2 [Acaulospora colombiana]|uniref:7277_t:CDS:1 n=1 Tax=Acaulospora colombiana TaxID=27376 RepID=A0ACA9LGA5_9GLOM|nr:7277_t:CDS:2 [Acaulospora colombiana]
MGLLEDVARLIQDPESKSTDTFTIEKSPAEGAGLTCFATKSLPNDEIILQTHEPVASVIVSVFRKEVCSWCYAYGFGAIHKFKLQTPNGRGVAWFCQPSCRDAWRESIGDGGWEAIVAFEQGLKATGGDTPRSENSPCSLTEIEDTWERALKEGKKVLTTRQTKPHSVLKTSRMPPEVDLDDARFILSGLISFSKSQESLRQVLRLNPSMKPYTSSRNTLRAHVAIYHYLLSVLPLASPILPLTTPSNIIALITRDEGNTFGIWDQTLAGHELFAYCLYPIASYFNHSCEPNVSKDQIGRVYEFRAKGEIAPEAELNVSYLGVAGDTLSYRERQQKLLATEYHLGLLKAKLAKYRAQLLEPTSKSSGGGTGFDVQKAGGRQVVSTAKTADLIIMMLDATKSTEQRRLLEIELDAVGIRLNKSKPDVVFKQKAAGGLNATVKLTKLDEKTIKTILAGYKIHNCDITVDELIDVLIGTRKYVPCLYVFNKIDAISLEQMDKYAREDHSMVISCEMGLK